MKLEKPKINTSVFENFSKLTNEDENVRISGAHSLIQQMEKLTTEKELSYAVKRLIRGTGSSTSNSRIGFYTAFCGLLSANIENVPTVSEIFEIMAKEFKEDRKGLDSIIGVALICGAIIRSEKMLGNSSEEDIQEIVKHLISCSTKPSVAPLAYNFLAELVTKVSSDTVKSSVWPNISSQLNVTKDKVTINPTYLLLLIEDHHPATIDKTFYKRNWQSDKILCSQNLDIFLNLLWKMDKISLINHPIYVYFIKRLIDLKLLKDFWLNHVETFLDKSKNSKLVDMITINCAISILKSLEAKPKEVISLLTPNFLQMLLVQSSKVAKDEDIQEMHKEFYELLDQRLQNLKNDTQKLQALKLFNHLSVEKNSIKKFITNLVNSLEVDGLTEAVDYIKAAVTNTELDDKERQYAATIIQKILMTNKLVSNNPEWRIEQLNFFVNLAFLKSKDGTEVTNEENYSNSIAGNVKNLFYHSLEHKYPKIEDEKKVLIGVINHINEYIAKDSGAYIQKPLESKYTDIWTKMYEEVTTKPDKKDKKLKNVFHVLLMHMGLQLFNNSEVAENAISELLAVLERAVTKKTKSDENEPEWIEVVVDLFLTLLSQESYVLRKVIQHIFPSLCSAINVSAFHQILSMLDIRNKENPLQINDDEEDEESGDEEEDEELDENGVDEEMDDESESDEEASDVEMISDDENEENAIQDTVRLAVQNALKENGDDNDNDDDSDLDVDKISPEEGKRLNEALGNAFKMLMEHRNLKKKKKTKSVLMADKALLHFRMRILDLVEIYLKNSPQIEICLEILLFFFDLMPLATTQPELKVRFEKIFVQLSQLKTFSLETVQNVTQKNLAETFKNVLEKTSREKTNIQQQNYFKHTCVFIIYSSHILQKLSNDEDDEVLKTIIEHMTQFISHRNPALQLTTFMKILSIQWPGNFKLARMISDDGLKPAIRSLRRIQSLQMLREFFKNHFLFQQNQKRATKYFTRIFDHLKSYAADVNEVPQPEFFELVHFVKAMKNFKEFTAKDELIAAIQKFRKHLILKQNILNAYRDLCNSMKFEFIPNDKIDPSDVKQSNDQETAVVKNGDGKRKQSKTNKKEKKLKKIQELEEASKGLDASFSFA
ncbi:myb-binding protein 1A [Chironomus tepperi]|uniref:myb-binding protein 1A n=1 Tax=Chironomus tepperi TaxID=113505 RepID=UPI00391F08B4